MGFKINTDVFSMSNNLNLNNNQKLLSESLTRLHSGLKINKSADDGAGLIIADKLQVESNTLSQVIKNANDAIAIMEIADKAMGEQSKILDTIKVKATQASQDGHNTQTLNAIEQDISKLIKNLDSIAKSTTFNGNNLLDGSYTNKKFNIGEYNQNITLSIQPTTSSKLGNVIYETTSISADGTVIPTFNLGSGMEELALGEVIISTSRGTGVGVLAEVINQNSSKVGVRASWANNFTSQNLIRGGDVISLSINGVKIGYLSAIEKGDPKGIVVDVINRVSDLTGVRAYMEDGGQLTFQSIDGRGIIVSGAQLNTIGFSNIITTTRDVVATGDVLGFKINGVTIPDISNVDSMDSNGKLVNAINNVTGQTGILAYVDSVGRLSLESAEGNEISVGGVLDNYIDFYTNSGTVINSVEFFRTGKGSSYGNLTLTRLSSSDFGVTMNTSGNIQFNTKYKTSLNLQNLQNQELSFSDLMAIGAYDNLTSTILKKPKVYMSYMDVADSAIKQLNRVRGEVGSNVNQLIFLINSMSIMKVNVLAAASQIRDIDMAEDLAHFKKRSLLIQAGSYAMSQSIEYQQNLQRLLL